VTALFLGRVAADLKTSETNHSQIVELITAGRSGDIGISAATAAESA
jgi:D-xylose transport system ATP-binding protein